MTQHGLRLVTRMRWILGLAGLIASAPHALAQDAGGRRVVFERFGYRLKSVGETIAASAGVLDASLRPVPNAPLTWRVDNAAIATVTPRGIVQARSAGYTRLWAVSGRDSASAVIVVVLSGVTIEFNPSPLRFDAAGGVLPLRIHLLDPSGAAPLDLSRSGLCRSRNDRIATLGAGGTVRARASGVTYIHCTARRVSDSVRVEVGQRPARITIANAGGTAPLVVGDTLRVRARAENGSGEAISESASWTSLNRTVLDIDSESGLARALAPGTARVVAQLGSVADTLNIEVLSVAATSLRIEPITPFVGDTVHVSVVARDAAGAVLGPQAIENMSLRSTRSSVVFVIGGQRVVALGTGTAWLVAMAGPASDSIQITPRDRNIAAAPQATNDGVSVLAQQQRARQRMDSIRAAAQLMEARRIAGRLVVVTAGASRVSHSANLAQGISESRSGLLVGGTAAVAPDAALMFAGDFRTGTLNGDDAAGDLKMTEVRGQFTYWAGRWFGLRGGYTRRSESTDLALHRWQFANISALSRFAFRDGAIQSVSSVSQLPWGSFSGYVDNAGNPVQLKKSSYALETGVEFHYQQLRAGIAYSGEYFAFPDVNGASRRDQFSSIRLRVGVETGRWNRLRSTR